ncbi:hypothetical protein MTR67_047762 [Solanum verrucosum]|uniref:Exocyst complex component Sec10 n=1 Tax=Solanum verrucosum TaxID=315347 RepID=A0AAF0ZVW5_SOLVR|nr:hypothetical protein MTR67_047762 [Solanum verrucosum]
MKEIRDGAQSNRTPLVLDVGDFKGDFSFDGLFGDLVTEVLPSCLEKEVDSLEGHGNIDGVSNGHMRAPSMSNAGKLLSSPLFPEVDALLSLFKNSSSQLVEQKRQVDAKLSNLTKEVSVQDLKHRKTLAELEKGVDGLFGSFARLDSRISSVGHTAAKIGDHLQSADTQRESASQTIELIKYLMEFNRSAGDLTQLSPLFIDDNRVAEAASIAQKLSNAHYHSLDILKTFPSDLSLPTKRSFADEDIGRQKTTVSSAVGNATSNKGLEVAITNLQEYCNVQHEARLRPMNRHSIFETRNIDVLLFFILLARFDTATQKRDLSTMGEYGKILSQFNRGTSAMQHYVGLRPMFDVEVMNADAKLVLGDEGAQPSPSNVAHGLSSMFKEIADTVRKEAATIAAVFPSPKDVMSILVQQQKKASSGLSSQSFNNRVLEDRVPKLLEKLLLKPSLVNPPPMAEGGLVLYLRLLAVAYEKTQEFDKELRSVGCGDLDVEGLTESLFLPHKDIYIECEQASLKQLYKAKMDELRSECQLSSSESSGTIGRSKGASIVLSNPEISVTVVTEFVRWNEEAISRCSLFSLQIEKMFIHMTVGSDCVGSSTLDIVYAEISPGTSVNYLFRRQPAALAASIKPVFTCLLDQAVRSVLAPRRGAAARGFSSFKDPLVPLLPNGPPDAGWDCRPPSFLAFASSSSDPTAKQICSMFRHDPVDSSNGSEHNPNLCHYFAMHEKVSQYIIGGLERSREGLTEAAALREKHLLGTSVSRRVAAAAASAAENAAAAGESSFKSFMASVQRCGSSVAILQQYFVNSISRRLLPVDGAHAASSEEMATAMSRAESVACKGLQQCIETVIAEVERLLSTEQKATDYRSPDDGIIPDHRPTSACACAVAYLSRVLESAFTGLEGLNKQAFLTELEDLVHILESPQSNAMAISHWILREEEPPGASMQRGTLRGGPVVWAWDFDVGGLKFETPCQRKQGVCLLGELVAPGLPSADYLSYVVNSLICNALLLKVASSTEKFSLDFCSGGLRLKRDITEYGEFVRSFNAPPVDEKFEQLGIIANVFIVAPASLGPLFEGTPSIKKDAQRFIQLRDDYKNAKLASKLSSLWS